MASHLFISHSSTDAPDFAIRLRNELEGGPPSIPVWLDQRDIQPGQDWDEAISEAIKTCDSLLFVMTLDSVEDNSVCKREWTHALKYKKPIIPIKLHPDAEMPFRLAPRHYIDFTHALDSDFAFNAALARLRKHVEWLASPAGTLQALKDRLEDAERDWRRAARDPMKQARIQADIDQLRQQIADQQRIVADPQAAAKRVEESIKRGLERERQPDEPPGGMKRTKFINPTPGVAPTYYQDRHFENKLIGNFLKDDALRLLMVVGRAGIGKTAMVCRLLKALESGQLPDDGGPLSVDGIVYLSAIGSRRVTVPNLHADLSKLLPGDLGSQLDVLYKDPRAGTEAKMQALLAAFPTGCTIVLLDNFESVIDPETRTIRDSELDEALRALIWLPPHGVKVILTTRIAPRALALVHPERQSRIDLGKGLPSPYAENILREMDVDGTVGLKFAPDDLLGEARERTRGYPRALEALYAILSADRDTSLGDILNDTAKLLPEYVVEVLVGEAFSRLDPTAQQVMQALAVYARPVTPAAVDYLLQPYLSGVNSAPALSLLVNMQFAHKESGRYYLHPVDRTYAFARVTRGEQSDPNAEGAPPFTQFALLHRAAEYFKQARTLRENWTKIEDLTTHLAEFELRYAGEEYDTAASVLLEISDYFFLWGYYRLVTELHECLQGKIRDPAIKQYSVGTLGTAYWKTGRYQKAILYLKQALDSARDRKDRQAEISWLVALGNCYFDLGQTALAIDYQEQALAIARDIKDRSSEAICLTNLVAYCSVLGQADRALEYYNQAHSIVQETGDWIAAGYGLINLANELVEEGRYDDAVRCASASANIGDRWSIPGICSYANSNLSRAFLYAGKLPDARSAAEIARRIDEPSNNHYVLALLGLIGLRQGDRPAAQEALVAAVAQADALLVHSGQNYKALDAKGLALCGLTLCEGSHRVPEAIEAYRAARAINNDAGTVGHALRLFDALAQADGGGLLAEVRRAAIWA